MSPPLSRQIIVLSNNLRLVPVVEFIASDSARDERSLAQGPSQESVADGQRGWERELTNLGFVPLSRLTEPHVLRELLRSHLELIGEGGEEEQSRNAMLGGQALLDGEHVVLPPRCCCVLDSLAGWEAASHQEGATFDIGHPDVWADWAEPWLLLREDEEDSYGREVLREWRLSPQALQRAVSAARKEQEAFAHRLDPLVAERFPSETVHPIAATLAGLR